MEADHGEGGNARYSDFFDLDYFSAQTGVAFAEWRDVTTTAKQSTSTEQAQLGCWGHSKWYAKPLERYMRGVGPTSRQVPKLLTCKTLMIRLQQAGLASNS